MELSPVQTLDCLQQNDICAIQVITMMNKEKIAHSPPFRFGSLSLLQPCLVDCLRRVCSSSLLLVRRLSRSTAEWYREPQIRPLSHSLGRHNIHREMSRSHRPSSRPQW